MNIALNIAALLLVIGISWFGVIWLAGFFHKDSEADELGDSGSEEEIL
mgnify:CR=1|tara:strand:- start:9553 stop:9696 length:144 start_codon:yes stop_codon:yes gene_type:complete